MTWLCFFCSAQDRKPRDPNFSLKEDYALMKIVTKHGSVPEKLAEEWQKLAKYVNERTGISLQRHAKKLMESKCKYLQPFKRKPFVPVRPRMANEARLKAEAEHAKQQDRQEELWTRIRELIVKHKKRDKLGATDSLKFSGEDAVDQELQEQAAHRKARLEEKKRAFEKVSKEVDLQFELLKDVAEAIKAQTQAPPPANQVDFQLRAKALEMCMTYGWDDVSVVMRYLQGDDAAGQLLAFQPNAKRRKQD